MSKKIIFSTGGTGGHIFPAINMMKHFLNKGYEVLLITDTRGRNFIKEISHIKTYIIKTDTPTKKNLFRKFLSYIIIFLSVIKSYFILRKEKPDLIFGFGGYVSFPICFASIFSNSPLIIYENNMILGRANNILSLFAKKILLAKKITNNYSTKFKNKISIVGTILDKNILNYQPNHKKKDQLSVLVIGGSQGAEIFGTIVPVTIQMIKKQGYDIEIFQQCLQGQINEIKNFYEKNNIKNFVFQFHNNIKELISSSTIAITRCGASSTAEFLHTLTPFIAVPLPNSVDNHQYLNAKYYENLGCCWILEQKNFNSENLFNLIMENIKNQNKLETIRQNMKNNRVKDVYINIENNIKEFI